MNNAFFNAKDLHLFRVLYSSAILENIQFIFDDFLKTQSIIKRLKVESVSLGEVPIRIKRIRTSLPEDNVAATKTKSSKAASKKFEDLTEGSFQEKQHMSFDYLLQVSLVILTPFSSLFLRWSSARRS